MPPPINAKVIALDETEHWFLDGFGDDAQYVERVEGVYWFDKNTHTHCCEFTPSYWLYPVEHRAVLRDDTPDEAADRIDHFVKEPQQEGMYAHVPTIDRIVAEIKASREKFRYASVGRFYLHGRGYDEVANDVDQAVVENSFI